MVSLRAERRVYSMAHIEKRGPNRWRARYRDPGGKERSRTFARKVDAERWIAVTEASKVTGDWINPDLGKITVEEWAWKWFATTEGLRESGRERNRSYLRTHIIPTFGHRPIKSIDHSEVQGVGKSPQCQSQARDCANSPRDLFPVDAVGDPTKAAFRATRARGSNSCRLTRRR